MPFPDTRPLPMDLPLGDHEREQLPGGLLDGSLRVECQDAALRAVLRKCRSALIGVQSAIVAHHSNPDALAVSIKDQQREIVDALAESGKVLKS